MTVVTVVVWTVLGAASIAALVASALRSARRRHERAGRRQASLELPGVVADIARAVRSGSTLESAFRDTAPLLSGVLGREVRGLVDLLDRGHGTDRALALWARASVVEGVGLVVAVCRFPIGGTGIDRALDGVAATLLDRIEVDDEMRALAAQARTSVAVLVALPPVGLGVFAVLDPSFLAVLLGTVVGRACLVLGTVLDVVGARVSNRVVTRCLEGPGRRVVRRTGDRVLRRSGVGVGVST